MASQPPIFPPLPPSQPPSLAYYAPQPIYVQSRPSNGLGTAAGIVGIVGLVLAFIPYLDFFTFVLGPLAIIFGAIGIRRASRLGGAAKGMAITGLVCGIIAVAITAIFVAAVYATFHAATATSY